MCANRVDGRRGHARLSRERHVRIPDIAAVSFPGRRADGELGVLRLDDALSVEVFADLSPGAGEAGAPPHARGGAADPAAAERRDGETGGALADGSGLVSARWSAEQLATLSA